MAFWREQVIIRPRRPLTTQKHNCDFVRRRPGRKGRHRRNQSERTKARRRGDAEEDRFYADPLNIEENVNKSELYGKVWAMDGGGIRPRVRNYTTL